MKNTGFATCERFFSKNQHKLSESITSHDKPHQHDLLVQVGGVPLQVTGHHQHGLERSETKVVVKLLAELLLGELVQHRHLLGEYLSREETLGEEHDLANHLQVGHDAHDRSVVWGNNHVIMW